MNKLVFCSLLTGVFLISCSSPEKNTSVTEVSGKDSLEKSVENEVVYELDSALNARASRLAGKSVGSEEVGANRSVQTLTTNWDMAVAQKFLPIKKWGQEENLGAYFKKPHGVFYPFSGPDFPFVNTFYPDAELYILIGLEEVGSANSNMFSAEPDYDGFINNAGNYFYYSNRLGFFRTADMNKQFKEKGVVDIFGFYLTKLDCKIISMDLMKWDNAKGAPRELQNNEKADVTKIAFLNQNNAYTELYYFQFDLSNTGISKNENWLKWVDQKMDGKDMVSLSKSASYLMHHKGFSSVANFILEKSKLHVQDDTGIGFRSIKKSGRKYRLYGAYTRTIAHFKAMFIPELSEEYASSGVKPLPFKMGYSSAHGETNLQLIY